MTKNQIQERLEKTYLNSVVEVVDLTGTEDHWQVTISTDALKGLSRVRQHQAIMDVFGPELKTGEVHALTIKIKTP